MNTLSEHTLVERATGRERRRRRRVDALWATSDPALRFTGADPAKAFDVLSDDDNLPLDSLLGAISRFSLQTSARNQWFGTVTGRDHSQVQEHIEILLADGTTRLKAAITAQSGQRLGLNEGQGGAGITQSALDQHRTQP